MTLPGYEILWDTESLCAGSREDTSEQYMDRFEGHARKHHQQRGGIHLARWGFYHREWDGTWAMIPHLSRYTFMESLRGFRLVKEISADYTYVLEAFRAIKCRSDL